MFGYVGSSQKEVDALYGALKKASSCDPRLKEMVPGHDGRHRHGWGYVIRTSHQLFHYRTPRALDEDDHCLPVFNGEIQAIFHARLSTGGVLGDAVFSHPYVAYTNQAIFFFAHNGGLKDTAKQVPNKVDSEWALDQIVGEGDIAAALPKLKENTQTALNILLMTINREARKAAISYLNWYDGRGDKKKDGYYQMYKATMSNGGEAVFSSTLGRHLMKHIAEGSKTPVEYGKLQNLCLPSAKRSTSRKSPHF
jgi:predicted glutamine amidotransferase